MNFQPLIDNIHYILPGIAMVIFAFSKFADYKAKKNPGIDWWDSAADRSKWVLEQYQWGLDQLIKIGAGKWSGAEKLAESTARAKRFEELWNQGKVVEALAEVTGFRRAVQDKIEKAAASQLPFVRSPNPPTTTPPQLGQTSVHQQIAPGGENTGDSGTGSADGSQVGQELESALGRVRGSVRR